MEKKSNMGLVIGLVIVIIILGVLCVLFATGTINFDNKVDNDVVENEDTILKDDDSIVSDETLLSRKYVDSLDCSNYNDTYNNINISINQVNDNGMCVSNSILVNNQDIKNVNGDYVSSYEFYDDKVILLVGNTSNSSLIIYDTNNLVTNVYNSSNLENYNVKSYVSDNNGIIINAVGCGEKCGVSNDGEEVVFRMEYINSNFTNPVIVNE